MPILFEDLSNEAQNDLLAKVQSEAFIRFYEEGYNYEFFESECEEIIYNLIAQIMLSDYNVEY